MSTFEKNINSIKVNIDFLNNHLPDNKNDILECLNEKYYVIPKIAFHGDSEYQSEFRKHNYTYDDYEQYVMKRASILVEIRSNERSIEQIDRVLNLNISFGEFIESLKLIVRSEKGDIPVTRETMSGFNDNQDLMKTRKDILRFENEKLNIRLEELKEKKQRTSDGV